MFNFLNRVSGITLGAVLYTLKSLLINVGMAGFALIAALGFWIMSPPSLFVSGFDEFDYRIFFESLFNVFLLPPIVAVLIPIVAIIVFVMHSIFTIYDVFRCFALGVIDGAEHGLSLHVLYTALFDFKFFSLSLKLLESLLAPPAPASSSLDPLSDEASMSIEIWRAEPETFLDTVAFEPLTKEELEALSQFSELSGDVERYKGLFERLEILDMSIRLRELIGRPNDELPEVEYYGKVFDVCDEFIPLTPIAKPSLIVKQYEEQPGCWRAIPLSTFITDRNTLEDFWIKHMKKSSFTHPSTRDPMQSPGPYNGKPTRYQAHEYYTMANAQELVEAACLLRDRLAVLASKVTPSAPSEDFCGQFLGLFSRRSTSKHDIENKKSVSGPSIT